MAAALSARRPRTPPTPTVQQPVDHPAGFADLVAKVKPAVISVQVKIAASAEPASMQEFGQQNDNDDQQQIPAEPGSPLDKFFQQFNQQFGQQSGKAKARRNAMRKSPAKAPASSSRRTVMP